MDGMNLIQLLAIWAIPVIYAITIHEVAHGWVANRLGDKTAFILGRLTLNPIKHIDPVGTILVPGLLLVMSAGFIFGWAKPVPVNAQNFKRPRRDMALVAAAGPVTNLLMAIFWAMVAKIGMILLQSGLEQSSWEGVALGLTYMGRAGIMINLVLGVLNLLPIPPLDGSRVLVNFLPGRIAVLFDRFEPYGFFLLLFLLVIGVLGLIIVPPIAYLYALISGMFGFT